MLVIKPYPNIYIVQNLTFKIIRRMRSLIFNQNHEEKKTTKYLPMSVTSLGEMVSEKKSNIGRNPHGKWPTPPRSSCQGKGLSQRYISPCDVSRALTNRLIRPEDFSCHKKLFIIELVTRAFLRTCVSGSGDYQILKRFVFRMRVWHLGIALEEESNHIICHLSKES